MGWRGLFGMFGIMGLSSVKTEWNCALSRCVLCSGVVIRMSLWSSDAAMLVVSSLRVL